MNQQPEPLRPLLDSLPTGMLLLLDRLDCGGAFLLPLLARAATQGGHKVLIIAAAHAPARHAAVLRKLGLTQQQGVVAFVAPDGGGAAADGRPPLQELLQRVAVAARQLLLGGDDRRAAAAAGLTVVLDSLDALAALAPGPGVDAFLHGCRALGAALPAPQFRLIVAAASDVPGAQGAVRALLHASDAVLALTPVEGRTAELDGRLDVTLRRLPWLPGGSGHSSGGGMGDDGGGGEAAAAAAARGPGCGRVPGTDAWHFRAGDVAVRWLPGQLEGRELMA